MGWGDWHYWASIAPLLWQCSRIRITADAKLKTCLFSHEDHDISPRLQADASEEQLRSFFSKVILTKEARHRIGETDFVQPSRGTFQIGGIASRIDREACEQPHSEEDPS
nr:hypothetical protein [Acidisarcina polymorpha]